jgi:hypothetical protein
MERRRHGANETAYPLKPYRYREWDWCKRCRRIQHYEKFKVMRSADIGLGLL